MNIRIPVLPFRDRTIYIFLASVMIVASSLTAAVVARSATSQQAATQVDTKPVAFVKHGSIVAMQATTTAQTTASNKAANTAATNQGQQAVTPVVAPVAIKTPRGLAGLGLYVDVNNGAARYVAANPNAFGAAQIARIGQQPIAQWFGGWNNNVTADVSAYVSAANGATPVLVAYNIPNRDCGGYSSGGARTEADYAIWIRQFSAGIGNRPAIVILEPDAIALQTCLGANDLAARNRSLSDAVRVLQGNTATRVYLDGGHSNWLSAVDMAARLKAAGISGADGFALNVSNFESTANNTAYGAQLSNLIGGKHFVIDTSRNGRGSQGGQWCNPSGAALGTTPTTQTGTALVDAFLWIKAPWESDGSCAGAPAAGAEYWSYATTLAMNAGW